ncbi:MAG: hypothetical protein CO133_03080, partial [Candidatus Komeilibacteria bacterium CG_4_9_14_3_um_filter_37_5]
GGMSALTVSVWIKTVESKTRQQIIYKRQNGGTPAWFSYQLYLDGLKPYFVVANASGTTGAALATNDLELNKWYHLVGVYDGSQVQIYVDTVAADATPGSLTGNVMDSDYYLLIGGLDTPDTFFVHGFIDDIRIYNYARTIAQIKQDYTTTKAGVSSESGATVAMGANNQRWLSDGLVGYWKMDESSWTNDCSTATVLDSSGNSNTGTSCPASTGPTGGAVGKFGKGGSFDGSSTNDDYLTVSGVDSMILGAKGTISAWAYPTATGANRYVFQSVGTGTNRFYIQYDGSNFHVARGNPSGTVTLLSSAPLATWYHLTLTWDESRLYGYLNGQLIGSATYTNSGTTGSGSLIGAQGGGSKTFPGAIDEVRVYNRTLTAAEVAKLYEWAPGPVGYWKLDDNTGITANDSSGSGYSGTLTSGPLWSGGKLGQSVKLDGNNDYINTGHNFRLVNGSIGF